MEEGIKGGIAEERKAREGMEEQINGLKQKARDAEEKLMKKEKEIDEEKKRHLAEVRFKF